MPGQLLVIRHAAQAIGLSIALNPRRLVETDRGFYLNRRKCTVLVLIMTVMHSIYKNISRIRAFPDVLLTVVVQNPLHAGDGDKALDGLAGSIGQKHRQRLIKQENRATAGTKCVGRCRF